MLKTNNLTTFKFGNLEGLYRDCFTFFGSYNTNRKCFSRQTPITVKLQLSKAT